MRRDLERYVGNGIAPRRWICRECARLRSATESGEDGQLFDGHAWAAWSYAPTTTLLRGAEMAALSCAD